MKYGNTFFLQLSREIFDPKYKEVPIGAKWMYVYLNELEHKYSGRYPNDKFIHSDNQIAKELDISLNTVKKYKRKLIEYGLIETNMAHWKNKDGKLSENHFTMYRILK